MHFCDACIAIGFPSRAIGSMQLSESPALEKKPSESHQADFNDDIFKEKS
jgi:hypothetical protein